MRANGSPPLVSGTSAGQSASDVARYRTLLEITNALVANLTREALFAAIATALRRVVPFERTAIFLHDPVRDVLRLFLLESSLPSSHFVVGLEVPSTESHVGLVFQHQRPFVRRDLEREQQYPAETQAFAELLGTHVQRLATIARGDAACTTHVPLEIPATIPRGRQSV